MENKNNNLRLSYISELLHQVIGKVISVEFIEETQNEHVSLKTPQDKPVKEYKVIISKIDKDLVSYGNIVVIDYGEANGIVITIPPADKENNK